MTMSDWLRNNSWALIMIVVSLVASYSVASYKIGELEKKIEDNSIRLSAVEASETNYRVTVAQIQKDIEFIRYQLSKLVK